MNQSTNMDGIKWWPAYQKYSLAMKKLDHLPAAILAELDSTTRLFRLFKEDINEFRTIPTQDIQSLLTKAEALRRGIQQRLTQSRQKNSQVFYRTFDQSIQLGLKEVTRVFPHANRIGGASAGTSAVVDPFIANQWAEELYQHKKAYLPIMEAKHEERKKKAKNESIANESDRVDSFLIVTAYWIKQLYALEYAERVLKSNLKTKKRVVVKEPLPLQFRLERNKPSYTVRLIKATYQKPTSADITVLDIVNRCYQIPIFKREGKTLVDDSDVIRFIRLHSVKEDLMNFRRDALSQIGEKMYGVLLSIVSDIKKRVPVVIDLLNKTPIQDIEYAFAGINPEECRNLLRLKFQSNLPGLNEDHYRATEGKKTGKRSNRTIEIMEEYERNFQKTRKSVLSSLKPTLAMAYWLRRMLTAVIRNNQALKNKSNAMTTPGKEGSESSMSEDTFDKFMMVGISYTIGDEDFSNFYVNPEDIIGSEMSIQRVDRTDKWIAVRKSDKTHRIRKKDFFWVIQNFIDKDLNKALKRFNLKEINLTRQLLPEIHERLGDSDRIDILRSGILGTTLTNLDEYRTADKFHVTLRRYFRKAEYNNIHYPDDEKLRRLAVEIANANTAILQMKYRRVLRIIEEITENLNTQEQPEEKQLLKNIKKIQSIMVFAKPSLKDVKLEYESDVIVIKSNP